MVTRLFAAFNIADGERDHLGPLALHLYASPVHCTISVHRS